jgi:uncharacterized protein YqgC (DUF456 family)
MTGLDLLVALAIAVGLAGVLVPVLPGPLLVGAAILLWGVGTGGAVAWTVVVVALALLLAGAVVKYLVPGRRLERAGVPRTTMLAGAALGVVGFFVVPVVGLLLGFVLGVYLVEWHRVGHAGAWPATLHALRAVGLGMVIELTFGVLAASIWAAGVVLT